MAKRPRIPVEVARVILVEAGHRCAVCGAPCPLERAHIIPWCQSKVHLAENLICLCANCHERADLEKWGEKTLRAYKAKPWILRQDINTSTLDSRPAAVTRLEMTIDLEIEDFDDHKEDMLRHALAGLLRVSPNRVRVIAKEKGSVRILIELQKSDAERLIRIYDTKPLLFTNYFAAFPVTGIKSMSNRRSVVLRRVVGGETIVEAENELQPIINDNRARLESILRMHLVTPDDAQDIMQDIYLTLIYKWKKINDPDIFLIETLKKKCIKYTTLRLAKAGYLDDIIASFPKKDRKILWLNYGVGDDPGPVRALKNTEREAARCLRELSRMAQIKWEGRGFVVDHRGEDLE